MSTIAAFAVCATGARAVKPWSTPSYIRYVVSTPSSDS